MKSNELCVPSKALSLPDSDQGALVAPAPGDMVDIGGIARVTRVDGDKTYLEPVEINGANVETMQAGKPETLEDEESSMRAEAKKQDGETIY